MQRDVRRKPGVVARPVDAAADLTAVDCHAVVGDRMHHGPGAAEPEEVQVDQQPHVMPLAANVEMRHALDPTGFDELPYGRFEPHQTVLPGRGPGTSSAPRPVSLDEVSTVAVGLAGCEAPRSVASSW